MYYFEKTDNNPQVSKNHVPSNDFTKEETKVNLNSLSNAILLQTAIATVKNENIQCKVRILFDSGSQSSCITPHLKKS